VDNIILFAPRRFGDNRGWFTETYNARREAEIGINAAFVQDNQSFSALANTVRGIHFQVPPHAQAKLVRCARGRLMDYVVDLRAGSPTYGNHVCAELSADEGQQLFIPAGFGHAFVTLEPNTEIWYKTDDYYAPDCDSGIRWDCSDIGIDWPLSGLPILSEKDRLLPALADFDSPFVYDGSPMALSRHL
jgi:dTDP-4-dehydrorhamnose 3,5-epimerase